MSEFDIVYNHIYGSLREGKPFALFSLPGEDNLQIADNQSGFCFSPWLGRFADKIKMDNRLGFDSDIWPNICEPTSYDDYAGYVGDTVSELRLDGGKTVHSRIISKRKNLCYNDISAAVAEILTKNPGNGRFHCAWLDPNSGIWVTATPELLAEYNPDTKVFETVALAGTIPAADINDPQPEEFGNLTAWSAKNREEQQMVVNFLIDKLESAGEKPVKDHTFTKRSGNVCHLCTKIQCENVALENVARLIDLINPTPAVCGLPRENSLQRISAREPHNRLNYCGFVGIEEPSGHLRLFVNLRTARLTLKGWEIHTGSGITALSEPDDEWRETALKAAPFEILLSKL